MNLRKSRHLISLSTNCSRQCVCGSVSIHTYIVYLLLYALPAVVQNYAEKVSVSLLLLSQAFSLFPALPLPLYHKHKHTVCVIACVHMCTYYFDFADRVNIDYTNVLEIKQRLNYYMYMYVVIQMYVCTF